MHISQALAMTGQTDWSKPLEYIIYHRIYIYIYDIGTKGPIGLNSFWTRVQTGPGYRIGDAYEKITVICNSILISKQV